MKKKSESKGFTLTEVLIAVAILAVFVSILTVGTSAIFGTNETIIGSSKAAVLGSDVMQVIANEIRYGEELELDSGDGSLKYNSASYGENCVMKVQDGKLVILKNDKVVGATTGEETVVTKTFKPLGDVAYDEVDLASVTFAYDTKTAKSVKVTVKVQRGGTVLWENSTAITPLISKL